MRAITDRVIGRLLPHQEKSSGGIWLPENRKIVRGSYGETMWMEIVSIGPEAEHVSVGQTVAVIPDSDLTFEHEGTKYMSVPCRLFDWITDKGRLIGIAK